MGKSKLVLVAAIMVIAAAGVSHAEMGIATMWEGSGIAPWMALPIAFGDNMVFQPAVRFESVSDVGTEFSVCAVIEKKMREGTTPLFGGKAVAMIGSPDEGDGWTNFGFGAFLGGSADLADNVEILGHWGPFVYIYAEESPVWTDKTVITTEAGITLRWWVFE